MPRKLARLSAIAAGALTIAAGPLVLSPAAFAQDPITKPPVASILAWTQKQQLERYPAIEKVYKDGSRTIREQYRKDGSRGEVTLILENGVLVEANGHGVDIAALKGVVAGVDLGKIEALKRAAK